MAHPKHGMMNQMMAEQGNGCAGGCSDNAACGQGACCVPAAIAFGITSFSRWC